MARLIPDVLRWSTLNSVSRDRVARIMLEDEDNGAKTPAGTPELAEGQSDSGAPDLSALAPADGRGGSTPPRPTTLDDYVLDAMNYNRALLGDIAEREDRDMMRGSGGENARRARGIRRALRKPRQQSQGTRYLITRLNLGPTSDEYMSALYDLRKRGASWGGVDFAVLNISAIRNLRMGWRRGDRIVFFGKWFDMVPDGASALANFFQERWNDIALEDVQCWSMPPAELPGIYLKDTPAPAARSIDQRRVCITCGLPAFTHRYAPDNTSATPAGTWDCLTAGRLPAPKLPDDMLFLPSKRQQDLLRNPAPPLAKPASKPPEIITRTVRDYGNDDE